ncbi:MAG: hypothetical protein H6679_05555 [Epsilonproteobacteria bacterium]|nr:hypothetical protein [Campylobacterota bacterium]
MLFSAALRQVPSKTVIKQDEKTIFLINLPLTLNSPILLDSLIVLVSVEKRKVTRQEKTGAAGFFKTYCPKQVIF